ncbi:UTP--glucose-1-phosphate uridylyltransferase [bacterium]|nr:MAG: UTP--glucose-1-phosphate uridylyltransferase [bacterium]
MEKITKAIVPVAGLGTRFLPVTKALPKEMLPIVDKPVVQYVVEELVRGGITDIIFVTGQGKRAIEDHFDFNPILETWLEKSGKTRELEEIRKIASLANFVYIRQKGPYGNGTPVLNARHLIGKDEPFVLAWGDEFFQNPENSPIGQILDVYEKYQNPVLCVHDTDDEGTKRFGIVEGEEVETSIFKISKFVEKPGPSATKSRLAHLWSYVLTPDIFTELERTPIRNNELWLADAVANLGKKRQLYAKKVDGKYFDVGTKSSWLKTNLAFGLANDIMREDIEKFLKNMKA